MSGQQYLNTITENASRLGMRLQESFSEHTRDLAFTRGTSAGYLENADDKSKNFRKQLDSNSDREKLDAMKRLIALISKGRNVSEYFAQVVKNVASQNLEIRKLVYIYLLRYAEHEPDLALLSINTFQKDLTDSNPLIRAMALRVLSGIKVPMIGNIVVMAIKKCAADISPYVRKTAALAIPKCYNLDSTHLPSLIDIITNMLKERSPLTIGSVAVAFESVCPTRLDLLHQHFRRLCRMLADVDEWGQVDLINLLLRYSRTMLPRPIGDDIDPDVKLLLTSVGLILMSCNSASVMAALRVLYYLGTPTYWEKIISPLLRLLHKSREIERVVLVYILVIARKAPELFAPYYSRFLLRTDDTQDIKRDKLKLLLKILSSDNYGAILREFIDYSQDVDDKVVSDSIHAIGRCAFAVPESRPQCLSALLAMIRSGNDSVISPAVIVLKTLVQAQLSPNAAQSTVGSSSETPISIISRLARKIDDIKHAQARACVIWLVGQYATSDTRSSGPEGVVDWAPDVLRKTAKTFGQEASIVKLQIVTLAAKLLVLSPVDKVLALLTRYVFSLARYDLNYDVRDRAKMISSLLLGISPTTDGDQEERSGVVLRREQVRLVLFEGKSSIVEEGRHSADEENALLGSLSVVLGKPMQMDSLLPDWLENGVEPSLRDSEDDKPTVPVVTAISSAGPRTKQMVGPIVLTPTGSSRPGSQQGTPKQIVAQDLDSFYAGTVSSESESEEDDEDEDENEDEVGDEDEENKDGGEDDEIGTESGGSDSDEISEEEGEEGEKDALINPRASR